MVFAFDTLAYSEKLRDAGLPSDQAEAHAEAARESIMAELVTRRDLDIVHWDIALLQEDLITTRRDLQEDMTSLRRELTATINHVEARITLRLGGVIAAAVAVLAAVIKP